jgi:ABC-2 type transport system permease protein
VNKAFVIAKREFFKYLRSKWFRAFFILPFIGIGLLYLIFNLLPEEGFKPTSYEEKIIKIGVVDHSGKLFPYLTDTEDYNFIEMDSVKAIDMVMSGEIEGFLIFPSDSNLYNPRYYSRTIAIETNRLRGHLNIAVLKLSLEEKGLDISLAEDMNRWVYITPHKITEEGGEGGGGELIALGMFMVIFLYMIIIFASQLMARSAVEEKLNGMIELIISDITPAKLLLGKLMGVTASIFLLVVVWILIGTTFIGNSLLFINRTIEISLPIGVILYFIGAFLFGYILYTSFVLVFVSAVTSEQEVNQAVSVAVIVVLIPYFLSFFWVLRNPSSIVSIVSSMIPFFTPLVMPLRLSISSVPIWESILSIIILALAAWGTLFLASKVYRVSMLMVGKPLRLSEILRLIRKR